MADNWRLDIINEGSRNLAHALALAFTRGHKATHYCDHPKHGLVLLWTDNGQPIDGEPACKLPFPLVVNDNPEKNTALQFVSSWLESAEYGDRPDIDGDSGKGWRLYNEAWGQVANNWAAFVAIQPAWSLYGK
jgi:hypothetical protein